MGNFVAQGESRAETGENGMTDNDLVRVVNMKATDAEYSEYARLLAAASEAAWKAAKCAAMLVAKYEPGLIGWGGDFEGKGAAERVKAAGRSRELVGRVLSISGQLRGLARGGKPSGGSPAEDGGAEEA